MIILYKYIPYISLIPILAGLIKWKYLEYPIRIFVLIMVFSSTIGVIARSISERNLLFYINALISVVLYGFFFEKLLCHTVNKHWIWLMVAFVWLVIGYYLYANGFNNFQLQVLIPFDLFMITFSSYYIFKRLKSLKEKSSNVLILTAYLFFSFCVALVIDLISTFLYKYLSNSVLDLLWKNIVPVYNLIKVITISIIILTVKIKMPTLDRMPSFERE